MSGIGIDFAAEKDTDKRAKLQAQLKKLRAE